LATKAMQAFFCQPVDRILVDVQTQVSRITTGITPTALAT